MSWTTVVWSMVSAACLTLAFIHLPVWLRNRAAWPNLFFFLLCVGTAGVLLFEAWLMQATTPEAYAAGLRWRHVPIWLVIVSLVGFIYFYLGAGRAWLAWSVVGFRSVALVANFTTGVNINFLEVTRLASNEWLGASVPVPVGIANPWMVVAQLGTWSCVAFVVDASLSAWRRGDRGRAARVGGASAFFMFIGAVQAALIVWGGIQLPSVGSLFFCGILAAMAHELGRDLSRAGDLAAELRESERRMVLAAAAAKLGMWSRDLASGNIWVSDRWRELIGFGPDEPVTHAALLRRMHPEDRERVRHTLLKEKPAPGNYAIEFRVLPPAGGVRWIAAQGEVEADEHGHPVRARGASYDCTSRKTSEQETVLLRQEIAHVGRVAVVGQLAAGLAHEINQPLGAILRNAEAASLFLQSEQPDLEELRAILEDIRKDDQRAAAVIERIRALLRRQGVELRPIGVQDLFGDVASLLRPEAAARRIHLTLEAAGDLPPLAGDRIHLQQVLLNLVANGMDAIDESGQGVRSIVVSARQDGARGIEIAVSDSGRGIAANDAGRIFEPFFTTKAKGMGMGLSISRTIIEAHGGALWAESGGTGGARFLFTVPRAAGEGVP